MTYLQLITQLSEDTGYTKRELRSILRTVAKIVSSTLCSGQPVQWDAVGTFFNVPEGAHFVRNYKTGERYWTQPRRRIKYKPCETLRNSVRRSIALFKEEEPTEHYLPKKEKSHGNGQVRSGDRPREGGEGKDSREESTRQPQRKHSS